MLLLLPLLSVKGEYKASEQNIYFELKPICCLNEVVVYKLGKSKPGLKASCIDPSEMFLLIIELLVVELCKKWHCSWRLWGRVGVNVTHFCYECSVGR